MLKEYSYSGECEPTPCPCGVIHPWEYELEKSAMGDAGCYVCLKECEFCCGKFFELVNYEGCGVCAGCKKLNEEIDRSERLLEQFIVELAA